MGRSAGRTWASKCQGPLVLNPRCLEERGLPEEEVGQCPAGRTLRPDLVAGPGFLSHLVSSSLVRVCPPDRSPTKGCSMAIVVGSGLGRGQISRCQGH